MLYADLPGYSNPADIFFNFRPDLTIIDGGSASVLELTCCYEQNIDKSRTYKIDKYSGLNSDCKLNVQLVVYTLEVSSTGFINNGDLNKFYKRAKVPNINQDCLRRLEELCLRCSFCIFYYMHKPWPYDLTVAIV